MKHWTPALLLIAAALFVFAGCEGDQGPAGPAGTASCLQSCHTDDFQMQNYIVSIQTEFDESLHNTGDTYVRRGSTNSPECSGCHTTEGYQYRVANNGDTMALAQSSRISCFACHAPHSNENFNLRKTGATDLFLGGTGAYDKGESNTCAMCHQARTPSPDFVSTDPITSQYWGPHHGPQASVLSGNGAYEFTGATYGTGHPHNTISTGCVNCHMAPVATDGLAGGHSYKMVYSYHGSDHINDKGCQNGCHDGQDMTSRVETTQSAFTNDLDALADDLINLGWLKTDRAHVDPAGIPVSADARGAVFNYLYLLEDRSGSVHNPVYARAVLTATQNYVTSQLP